MPTSATGTPPVADQRGFTLLELLVVVAIAGLLAALAMLSLGRFGEPDPAAEAAALADRLALVEEELAFSGRTIGLRLDDQQVLRFSALTLADGERVARWLPVADDALLRDLPLGERFAVELSVAGTAAEPGGSSPSALLMPDGTATPFAIVLRGRTRAATLRVAPDGTMTIESDAR